MFAPSLLTTLFDIPVTDPTAILIGGGEFAVVTLVYVCLLADLRRFRPLLWLVALDQAFAVVLPAIRSRAAFCRTRGKPSVRCR